MSNEKQEHKARDPFVRLNDCRAIVNNLDYDTDGRLTYTPYNGVYGDTNKDNRVVNTPDPQSAAIEYNKFCVFAINTAIANLDNEIKRQFNDITIANIDNILTDRLKYEVATAAATIFNVGTRAMILPYIIDPGMEAHRYNRLYHEFTYMNFNNIFGKEVYDGDRIAFAYEINPNHEQEYVTSNPELSVVKSSRIISFLAGDIANKFTSYIYDVLPLMDVEKFTTDSIGTLGIDRSMISKDTDYPYTSSILNEQASKDTSKIIELIELLINHAYYIFAQCQKDIAEKSPIPIEESSTPPRINRHKPQTIPYKYKESIPKDYDSF